MTPHSNAREERAVRDRRPRWQWIFCLSCVLLLIVGFFIRHHRHEPVSQKVAATGESVTPAQPARSAGESFRPRVTREHRAETPQLTAEEIVAGKVAQFGRKQRELAYPIAR